MEISIDRIMADISLLTAIEEFNIHKDAIRTFIKDDQYDLYLYHKGYLKIYLDEIADCKRKLLHLIFSQK